MYTWHLRDLAYIQFNAFDLSGRGDITNIYGTIGVLNNRPVTDSFFPAF